MLRFYAKVKIFLGFCLIITYRFINQSGRRLKIAAIGTAAVAESAAAATGAARNCTRARAPSTAPLQKATYAAAETMFAADPAMIYLGMNNI